MAGVVGIFVTEGRGGHEIHPVGHGIGEDGRVPGVAGGEEAGEVVVVGQVRLVVVGYGGIAIQIVFFRDVVRGVEKIVHAEIASSESGGSGPGTVTAG